MMQKRFCPILVWLLFCEFLLAGCADSTGLSSAEATVPSPVLASTPASLALASAYPPQMNLPGDEAGYPAPQNRLDLDLPTAYPGMELTSTALLQTLLDVPTQTPRPPSPTVTAAPVCTPLDVPIPAPLYMMISKPISNPPPQQIWRLERDGCTLTQVTHEEKGVDPPFDVAADGRIAYVSDNRLIVTNARGEERRVLVAGKPLPLPEERDQWFSDKEEIQSPVWSPDGKKIAYRMDGVNLWDLTNAKGIKVVPGPKWVTNDLGQKVPADDRGSRAEPVGWMPDGSQVVLNLLGYERFHMALVSPVSNSGVIPIEAKFGATDLAGCCDYSFTRDGQMLFSSGDHASIGLWLIDPKTGKGNNLTRSGEAELGPGPAVSLPKQAPNGRIYFFSTITLSEGSITRLAYVNGKNLPFRIPEDITWASDEAVREGVLWLPDASRVIVVDVRGELAVMDARNGQVVPLGIAGYSLHWGPTAD